MALPVLPSNSFITRLLQQASQNSAINNQQNSTKLSGAAKTDQLNFSPEARQASNATANAQLESKLIELYNKKGENSAQP